MIGFGKWYMFNNTEDKRLFLDYFAYLKATQLNYVVDELDETIPDKLLNAECLMININNGYNINYRTKFNPDYMNAKYLTNKEKDFIISELYNKKIGDDKMLECCKETATVRSIMEREYNREMRELEDKKDKLIDEAYVKSEIGKQARLLADLINANTTLNIDFKSFIHVDIMPLSVQREISQIQQNFSKDADELTTKYQNLEAMLSICDTYEQKEKLLKKNHII